jgi:hypothetical protein
MLASCVPSSHDSRSKGPAPHKRRGVPALRAKKLRMSPYPLALLLILLLWSPLMAQERLVLQHDGKLRTVLIDAAPNVRDGH